MPSQLKTQTANTFLSCSPLAVTLPKSLLVLLHISASLFKTQPNPGALRKTPLFRYPYAVSQSTKGSYLALPF